MNRRGFSLSLLALGLSPSSFAKAEIGVLLANPAPAGIDPTPYLISEKLDGVRALWDGSVLRFRSGRAITAPEWFTAKLPATPLDGELWLGRGSFDALSAIVRKAKPIDAEWKAVQYHVFELPQGTGTFEQRHALLQSTVSRAAWAALIALPQFRLTDAQALQTKLKSVIQSGGEGLMLHLARAPVITGRSDVLLKLKVALDAEATVVSHVAGKGKYAGMMGALWLQTPAGLRFKLGTGFSDAQRRNPPAIGATVTYIYRDITPTGKPRFASFLRLADSL
jgi:DNA ligase 1